MKSIIRHFSLVTSAFAALCGANAEVTMPSLSWTPSNNKVSISDNIATVALPGTTKQSGYVRTTFDMSGFAGKAFELTVNASLNGVGGTTYTWEGLKFQFSFHDDLRDEDNNIDGDLPQKDGTTDGWVQLKLRFDPSQYRTTTATLALGIQQAYGTARFDLSSLAIRETPTICEPTNSNLVVSYPQRVTDMPPLKGVMSPTGDMNEGDFRTLHDWGATLLRFEMANCPSESIADIPAYLAWLRGRLDHLENVILPLSEKYGIKVVVDLHNTIGGRVGGYTDFALFDNDTFYTAWLDIWREIATRFRGDKRVYGYDLCNEPRQTLTHKRNYWQIQQAAAEAIREIDPDVTIVMEANAMDAPDAFYYLSPLSLSNVIYQVHMYEPGTYTHQGLDTNPYGETYPGTLANGTTFNKTWLRSQLAPVRAFQQTHGARILVGEFSAICWAPGADQYLTDLTDIFDEYGWDWCYMAFRAWEGWSLEHQENEIGTRWDFSSSPDNARKRAILSAIADGAVPETVTDYLRLVNGQTVTLSNATNDNSSAVKRIVFAGGSLRGTSFDGRPLCTDNGARWRLEGENGAPILIGDIGVQRFHWHTGDGFIETRGDSDVVLYTTSYHDTYGRGIVWLDDNRSAWDHTGNFVLSNAVKVVCGADNCLPHGNDTGGIWLKRQRGDLPPPLLDLNGHGVAVNAIRADPGGILTNSAATRATIRLGENDMTGMLAASASLPFHCANIDLEKTGAGLSYLDVKGSAEFGDVRVESGSFTVRDTSGVAGIVAIDALTVAPDATLVVNDTTLHAASYTPRGGTMELQGTGRFLYDTLVVEEGAPLALDNAEKCSAVLLRDTLTLASGGSLAADTAVVVDGPSGGIVANGGTLPASSRLSLAPDLENDAEYATVLDLRTGTTTLQCATNANPDVAARVLFSGGSLRGTSFSGTPFCSANGGKWILEGTNGADIVVGELGLQRISWLTGNGSIETRGNCDVVFYDCQYNAEHNWRGMVYLNMPNAAWNHEGDLVLSNAIHVVCQADNCLPVGSQTGDIVFTWMNRSLPAPLLDLNGHSVAVNGLDTAAGGIVTNSSASIATLRIGEGGESGAVALPALSGNIALAKRGPETNTVALGSSDLAVLRIESGTLVLTGASSDALSAASVEVAEGATLVLDGVMLQTSRLSGTGAVERLNGGDIEVAETRFTWFAADAATDTVTGGVWTSGGAGVSPAISNGAWQITPNSPALFTATVPQRANPRVEAEFLQDGALPVAWLDDLLVDAVTNGVRARIVAVDDGGEELSWRGLALVDGAPAWVRLEGSAPEPGVPCVVAAEFDFSGETPLVSYLAGGSGAPSVRLRSPSSAVWFPAVGSFSELQGRVAVSGSGDLYTLLGTTDSEPLASSKATVLIVR